ncbi:MAG: response regulator, partial [Haliangium ochraceum]
QSGSAGVEMSNLLIVDDDADLVDLLRAALEDEGHSVRTALNGTRGLEMVRELHPDAVLLDVDMPVLNGPDMAYRMFIDDCGEDDIPILLLSGARDLRQVAEEVGTPYYESKPYRVDEVLGILHRLLIERRRPVPLARSSSDRSRMNQEQPHEGHADDESWKTRPSTETTHDEGTRAKVAAARKIAENAPDAVDSPETGALGGEPPPRPPNMHTPQAGDRPRRRGED